MPAVPTQALRFRDIDGEDTSARRAREATVVIVCRGRTNYRVQLDDGEPHRTSLLWDQGTLYGGCDCPGWMYHDGPCAHLWAVWQAAAAGLLSIATVEAVLAGTPICPECGATPPGGETA